ncbi:MAG TPA: 5'-nucleotidase C-terminal domain-containing protein [Gaiellaceae bacterium]|nr:5'-nucleotidase C-terminal domain-containing protein [Gaiellaceae bacterium]
MKRALAPALAGLILLVVLALGSGGAGAAQSATVVGSANRVVLFSSDGMRPDLMDKYSDAGSMPTYAALRRAGVEGQNGMTQAFPPNTGVGWYTMATGTYPGEHGSTNNTFHRTGESNFNNSTSFSTSGILQADTIAKAAERAGKKVAQVEWVGGRNAGINGPTVDFANFFSTRGVLAAPLNTTEQSGAAAFGISYQLASFSDASGWTNVPGSSQPAKQTTLTVATTFAAQNPTRTYDVYIYAAGGGYDHALLVRTADGKDGTKAAVNLAVGDFKEIKLRGADGLIGARASQTAGFYVKLISLAGDLSNFKLYFTSVERVIATCNTPACASLPGGNLENYLADNLPTAVAADFAPLEARIIDEDTYVQQGRDLEAAYGDAVMEFILKTLQPDTDLALVGYPVTDEFSHQFMGLVTPTDMDGNANPYFDDVEGNGVKDGLVAKREGYIRSVYTGADSKLAMARQLMGGNPTTFAGSDHGFAAQWLAGNARKILFDGSVNGVSLQASGGNTASNCRAAVDDLTKACWAGGTAQIYVNPKLPSGTTYEQVRSAVIDAFQNLSDPARPGAKVVLKIMKKEELRNVDGSDSLHPNRSGDVVVVLRPPYQWDAATPGQRIAFSQFFGQHGYLPDLVDIPHNVNMHATFVAAGPGIRHQDPVAGIRAVDIAPTIALLQGYPGPQNARGRILYQLFPNPGQLKEITILDISDYHGQLIPLSEASDSFGPTFGIGGSAFLKPWFDLYRAEAPNGSVTIAAGDSVGATPPISSFFGDKPTIEVMNMMGIGLDGLGNHNFDRGQQYLRTQLIPLAKFPYVSANIVDSAGKTPAEWSPSKVFDTTFGGIKVGIVGFSNDDLPTLINPAGLAPFQVTNSTAAVNAEAARLKARGIGTIVAIGHLGATAGTLTAPTGPLVDLADNVSNVDAVIGDHTDLQVLATRPNGVLVTENRSKGIRFTRVRLVVDTSSKEVVYKTADFHKPWDIGMTADPAIQAKINDLNSQLAPILNTVIGSSSKFVPRADQCGNSAGRPCESLVGNITTDAMRTTYGVDFAITNSGGLRADLTCPTTDNPSDFCPAYTPPPFPITRGQVLTVLPFGNIVVTLQVNGAELKTMLENGVSRMPAVDGRFAQVSGLCFTYDIAAPAGSRVTGAVRQAADGSCTGAPVDLTAASTYRIAENDFMSGGGDGYPNFASRATSREIMDQVVADYIGANSPLKPVVLAAPNGRVNCAGAACPALTPSP